MGNNNQGLQANPQITINYLTQEVAKLTQENAMLKAIIQEQNENKEQQSSAVEE
ncbi:hypothetical protein KZA27_05145 [Staphylococcus capitis]|uniref:Phage protein n=1 Tax=Staphylococcus capitis TaxID=29388 RepID=A0A848F1N9_STACP|nr:hypothetical protein [Staphylococcus capitis]MDS0178509.1 hypothetical protein [Staphylococcus capitis]MDS0191407.1 hypothetical protein [Staphylococcus capitis]MDS0196203.1 hypothetical protein [Staphylococcus capitis]MDS0230488.1 hypothetical protein [Staphylococcus capitis]MDS0263025.1 hypothetical protein [Staphylococcus capitis]